MKALRQLREGMAAFDLDPLDATNGFEVMECTSNDIALLPNGKARKFTRDEKAARKRERRRVADRSAHEAASVIRRRQHLEALTRMIHDRGGDDSFEIGESNEDVVWRGGICTESKLRDMAQRMKDSFGRKLGFKRMWCLGMHADLQ